MLRTLRVLPALIRHNSVCNIGNRLDNSTVFWKANERPAEYQDEFVKRLVSEELITIPDFITEEEERSLFSEIDPILSRSRYQTAHWDDVGLI